jgi:hypothetical protein
MTGSVGGVTHEKEFGEITCPDDIWFDRRNTFGSVWHSTDRFVAAILWLFVTNTRLNAELFHHTQDSIVADLKRSRAKKAASLSLLVEHHFTDDGF